MENQTAQTDNSATQDAPQSSNPGEAGLIDTPDHANSETISASQGLADIDSTVATAPAEPALSQKGSWKNSLRTDLRDSPLSSKFEDTTEGLNQMTESYANLEQLLGHEKVPIPKDAGDEEGWNRYSKAMGIPDKAEGYGLPDANLPESMKDMTMDKNKFAEVMHAHKVHPAAVQGIWETYQQMTKDSYQQAMEKNQTALNDTVNQLKGQWGDAYDTNVELGQAVINKFSEDQDTNDYITTLLSQDPKGIKFLAKIGDQFAENKVPEFSMKRFSLAPSEAMEEVEKIKNDMDGAYWNKSGKFTNKEHEAAVARVNLLIGTSQKAQG
jgi:hypothetical protein